MSVPHRGGSWRDGATADFHASLPHEAQAELNRVDLVCFRLRALSVRRHRHRRVRLARTAALRSICICICDWAGASEDRTVAGPACWHVDRHRSGAFRLQQGRVQGSTTLPARHRSPLRRRSRNCGRSCLRCIGST